MDPLGLPGQPVNPNKQAQANDRRGFKTLKWIQPVEEQYLPSPSHFGVHLDMHVHAHTQTHTRNPTHI